MALNYQTTSVNFGQGVDTKTDPKLVVHGKMISLQNAVFTNAKRLSKRNGYDSISRNIIGGGTITGAKFVRSYGQRLVCADDAYLYDYSPTLSAWKRVGKIDSISCKNIFLSGANINERSSGSVVFGNYSITCYDAWTDVTDYTANIDSKLSVIDLQSNTAIASDMTILSGSNSKCSRVVLIGGTQPAVFYVSYANGLCFKLITINSSGVTLSSEFVTGASSQGYGGTFQVGIVSYDVVSTATHAILAYSSSSSGNPIVFLKISTSGVTVTTATLANAGYAFPLSLTRDSSNDNVWAYWATPTSSDGPTTSSSINYAVYSSTLSAVLGKTQIKSSEIYVWQITSSVTSSIQQDVYYSTMSFVNGDSNKEPSVLYFPETKKGTVTTSGVTVSPDRYLINVVLYGKSFSVGSKTYLPCVFPSTDQNSGFLIDLSDGHVAGKFLRNTAEAAYGTEVNSGPQAPGGYWFRYPGYLATPSLYNSTQVIFSAGQIIQSQTIPGSYGSSTSALFLMGTTLVVMDWNDPNAYLSIEANNLLVTNGSLVTAYDGSSVTELGFNNYPEIQATKHASGGSLSDGSYEIQAVIQWSDSQGNLHQSKSSDPITVAISGSSGSGSITVNVKMLGPSQKLSTAYPPVLNIYMTNAGGTTPYLVSQAVIDPSAGSSLVTIESVGFATQPIYSANGVVLDNTSLPSSMIMWLNNNRLWLIDSEYPKTNAWYSKTFSNLTGISFSDELVYDADPRLGEIKSVSAMDEKTVLLKERGALYFIGDGANDSGNNSSLSGSQIIPSDVGCSGSRGTILIPDGILFRAADNKGIYIVLRSVQIVYFGLDVEAYNSQDIQAASYATTGTQIRFLTSAGVTLVYDYIFKQWGTFTNHLGLSSTIWAGNYVYLRTDGGIYQENTSTFLDNGSSYAMALLTSWLKANQAQDFERIRMFEMLGDFQGAAGHGLAASVAYDFGSTFTSMSNFLFSGSNAPFQYRAFLPQQKCNAVQLSLSEITTGVSGEFVDLSDLGIELGLKRGLNKLSASNTVG